MFFPKMFVSFGCGFSSTWRAHEKSFLYQEGFVHVFDRAGFFADSRGDGIEADRTAFEFFDDGGQDAVVHFVQTVFVYIQRAESMFGDAHINDAVPKHLCKIAYPSQQAICNSGSTTTAS